MTVRSNSVDQLLLTDFLPVSEGVHRRTPTAHLPLMGSLMIVVLDPNVKIGLQFIDALVDPFPEGHLIELLQDGLEKWPEEIRQVTALRSGG